MRRNLVQRNEGSMTMRRQRRIQQSLDGNDSLAPDSTRLTPRERQVLDLIGKGKTTKEVAAILALSTGTVGNHRKSICRKLDAHSTAELVASAALGSLVRRT